MYNKAIVLEIKEEYALAMTDDGRVERIKKKKGLETGAQIYLLPEDLYREEKSRGASPSILPFTGRPGRKTLYRTAGVAAAFFLCLSFLLSPLLAEPAYAVVSLDAQFGVQVELDENLKILGAVTRGKAIPKSALKALRGKSLEEAGQRLEEFIGRGKILVGYASGEEGVDKAGLRRRLARLLENREAVYLEGEARDIKNAEKDGLSLGMYMAGKIMTEEEQEDRLDEMGRKELLRLLDEQPEWMKNPAFREAFQEALEDAFGGGLPEDEDREDDGKSGGDDNEDEKDRDGRNENQGDQKGDFTDGQDEDQGQDEERDENRDDGRNGGKDGEKDAAGGGDEQDDEGDEGRESGSSSDQDDKKEGGQPDKDGMDGDDAEEGDDEEDGDDPGGKDDDQIGDKEKAEDADQNRDSGKDGGKDSGKDGGRDSAKNGGKDSGKERDAAKSPDK